MLAGRPPPPPRKALGKGTPCLFQFLGAPGTLGLWPHHPRPHLHLHMTFLFPLCSLFLSHKDAGPWM